MVEASQLCGPPTAFTGNDFVLAFGNGAHHDGLHDALGANAVSQFLQGFRVNIAPRLIFTALYQVHRQIFQHLLRRITIGGRHVPFRQFAGLGTGTEQRIQPAPQSPFSG